MSATYRYTVKIPFYDVDSMRIVWHGNYVKYFEEARCAFFEHLGMTYDEMERAGFLIPVIGLSIKYVKPCVFGQTIWIDVAADETNDNLLVLSYTVLDAATGKRMCKGSTRHAAVDRESRELLFELPAEFLRRLRRGCGPACGERG
ncbi:MAG: acyl-CoA thioesterase [Kiritimatiellae bacterium]|nr:acyl-CoA thioesterase [Kiritimatiellia bacterium]